MRCADGCNTAIIASIGRTLCSPAVLTQAMTAGALGFRLPLGLRDRDLTADFHAIRAAARQRGATTEVLLDLPASRPRAGHMAPRVYAAGDRVALADLPAADAHRPDLIPVPGLSLVRSALRTGHRVFFRDGRQQFRVIEVVENEIRVECLACTEALNPCNGCSFPDSDVHYAPVVSEDLERLRSFADAGLCPDWVMVSFANSPDQIADVRDVLASVWPGAAISVMAKIETATALERIAQLVAAADGLLLGRGDLGLSIASETIPRAQNEAAKAARQAGKPLLVATQILEVYARTGEVYRAELSDIALAVRQGVAGLVLCAETNDSPRPVETIELARRVIAAESGVLAGENRR